MHVEPIRNASIPDPGSDAAPDIDLEGRHAAVSGRRVASVLVEPASMRARMRAQARLGDLSRLRFDVSAGPIDDPDIVLVYETLTPDVMAYVERCFANGAIFILDLPHSGPDLWARAGSPLLERAVALADAVTTDSHERAAELAHRLAIRRIDVVPDAIWPLPPRALSLCDPPGKLSLVWFGAARELGAFESLLPTLRRVRDCELRALLVREPGGACADLARLRKQHPYVDFAEVEIDQLGAFLTSSHVAVLPADPAPGAEGLPAWKIGTCALWGLPCLQARASASSFDGWGARVLVETDELPARLDELRARDARAQLLSTVQGPAWQRFSPLRIAEIFRDVLISVVSEYKSGAAVPRLVPRPQDAQAPMPLAPPMRTSPPGCVTPIAFRESRVAASLFSRMITDDVAACAIEQLEAQAARWSGAPYTIAVQSPRAALVLGLLERGIGRGDEVIVPALSPRSVAEAVLAVGAEPVLCDIDARTLALDAEQAEALLRERTRAIVVVDLDGQPAPLEPLQRLADRYGIAVLEFALDGIGGSRDGSWIGAAGGTALGLDCMGFGETTSIGFVTCLDAPAYERLRALRDGGEGIVAFDPPRPPAVPYTQMSRGVLDQLESQYDHHAAIIGQYERLLGTDPRSVAWVLRPASPSRMAPWSCWIRSTCRDALRSELAAWKIGTELPSALPHRDPLLREARRGDLRESERVHGELLALPVSRGLSARQRLQIDRALRAFLEQYAV